MLSVIIYCSFLILIVLWIEWGKVPASNLLNLSSPAEELEDWLKKFSWNARSEIKTDKPLPHYKFYTGIVQVLLDLARRLGGHYQEAVLFLREGLVNDRQFEKKLSELRRGTWFQMLLVVLLTWVFITSSLGLVKVKISYLPLLLIGLWQLLGLILLPLSIRSLRRHFFEDIGKLWSILYILKALARVPLSRTEIFTLAGVQELKNIRQKSLHLLVDKLKETLQGTLKQGLSYEEEVRYLMEELRFQEKWSFELFEKRLLVVKLALLSLFFLPSYLAFLFVLLGDLMDLM